MAVTITPLVTYPVPGSVRVTIACTASGNFVRLWCTDAPAGTQWRERLDNDVAARVEVWSGAPSVVELQLSAGGVYLLQAQEYTRGASVTGGAYDGDPLGFETETKIGAENALTISVGQRLVCRVGAPEYGHAELAVWVWGGYIRPTTKAVHGETTPAIVGHTTDKAKTAAFDATLAPLVAGLANQQTSLVAGTLGTLCSEIKADIPAHFNNAGGTWHDVAGGTAIVDSDNDDAIESLPAAPTTPAGYVNFANTVRCRLYRHMTNTPRAYHGRAGARQPDYAHALLSPLPAGADMAQVLAAFADIVACYELHRVDAVVHAAADGTNAITTALGALPQVHGRFIAAMRATLPTAPATLNQGAVDLIHGAGFVERAR